MTSLITKGDVDLVQGETENGRDFGYVSGEGDGGMFFTWMDTLDETIDSLDADETAKDGDGNLEEQGVADFLRSYLPTTRKGREMWGE